MQTFYYYFLVVLDELLLRVGLVAFWVLLQIGVLNSSSSSSLIFNFSILTSVSKRTGTAFLDFNWGSLDGLCLTILGVRATWASGYIADPGRIGDGSKFKFLSFLAKAKDMAASLNTLVQYGIGFWKKKIKINWLLYNFTIHSLQGEDNSKITYHRFCLNSFLQRNIWKGTVHKLR